MLFAYLIANRSRGPLRREELMDVVWETHPPADPDASLSTLLSRLRTQLGRDVLPQDTTLQLPEDASVDVELIKQQAGETLHALKEGRPLKAVELAAEALTLLDQEFLPELEASWIDGQRRELDELSLDLMRTAVEARLQLGGEELESAERTARELVERAPYRESGHKLLMEVLARRGDFAEANLVYERLTGLLLDELGKTPAPAITELNAMLHKGIMPESASAPPSAGTASTPAALPPLPPLLSALDEGFVGRDEGMARLGRRWEQVSIKPRVAVLTGEPGIGKTRMAACFSRQIHSRRGIVLYGACHEDPLTSQPFAEAISRYARVHDLARELPGVAEQLWRYLPALRHLLRGAEPKGHAPEPQDPYALFEAVAAVLCHAAEARPLLLVIDDIHWANPATFELVLHSVRSVTPSRCMILVTSRDPVEPPAEQRDGPPQSLEARLDALRHEADVEHICLEGLDERETAALIRARSDVARSDVFARRLWRRTGGNPLFVEEMLPLVAVEEEPDLDRIGVPTVIKHAIIRRLEGLGESSREVLASASVIGPQFTLSLLAAVLGSPEEDTLGELEDLIRYGLVVEVLDKRDHFAFSHALVRETQYGCLADNRRARIHKRVALELERRADSSSGSEEQVRPAELAHHFYQARGVVDAQLAARYSIEAAELAEHTAAHEQAGAHYGRAIELLRDAGTDENTVCDLLFARGKADLRAGLLEDARERFREAAAIARRTADAERLAHAALGFHGRYTAAAEVHRERIDLLEEALRALDPSDSEMRARVLARLADSLLWSAGARAPELSAEALRVAEEVETPTALLEALAARHTALLHTEHLEDRLKLSTKRLSVARGTGSDETIAAALRWCVHDLCESGDTRSAKQHYVELSELADRLRQPLFLSYARHWECVFAQMHGRFEQAERLADEAFELGKRAGATDAEMSRVDKRFTIYREQGRLSTGDPRYAPRLEHEGADDHPLRQAIERFAIQVPEIKAWWALLALADAEAGNTVNAREHVDLLLADNAAALPRDVFWLYALSLLAETCALLEYDSEPASVVYRLLLPYGDRHVQVGMDTFWGSVSRFIGLAAATCGEWKVADEHFKIAEARHEQMGSVPLLARTHLNHAWMLLRRDGRAGRAEAVGLLDRARRAADELDLKDVGRRAEELRVRAAATTAAP